VSKRGLQIFQMVRKMPSRAQHPAQHIWLTGISPEDGRPFLISSKRLRDHRGRKDKFRAAPEDLLARATALLAEIYYVCPERVELVASVSTTGLNNPVSMRDGHALSVELHHHVFTFDLSRPDFYARLDEQYRIPITGGHPGREYHYLLKHPVWEKLKQRLADPKSHSSRAA